MQRVEDHREQTEKFEQGQQEEGNSEDGGDLSGSVSDGEETSD